MFFQFGLDFLGQCFARPAGGLNPADVGDLHFPGVRHDERDVQVHRLPMTRKLKRSPLRNIRVPSRPFIDLATGAAATALGMGASGCPGTHPASCPAGHGQSQGQDATMDSGLRLREAPEKRLARDIHILKTDIRCQK